MKRGLISSLTTIVLLSVLLSCQKDKGSDNNKKTLSVSDFEIIGIQHNQGLSYVFNDLKEVVDKNKTKLNSFYKDSLDLTINKSVREFSKKIIEDGKLLEHYYSSSDKYTSLFIHYRNSTNKGNAFFLDSLINSFQISGKQREVLNEIFYLVENSKSKDTFNVGYNSILKKIDSDFETDNETAILYTALVISKYSFEYWYEYLDDWTVLLTGNNKGWFSGSEVVKWDIAGGIGGGLVGAIAGGTASLGVLTVPGWIAGAVGGAIGTSATDAAYQILDHFF